MHSPFRVAGAAAVLSLSLAAQTTWVVDINNGPGTNFTQIQPAIDAATAGDLIEVRTGFYQAFTMTKGVTIYADQFTSVDPGCVVRDLPAGETAAFQNIFLGTLALLDCDGVVLGDVLNLTPGSTVLGPNDTFVLMVRNCADVRLRQFGINPGNGSGRNGVEVYDSRFTVDGGAIDGARGGSGIGGTGLIAGPGANVHVAFSRVRGGNISFSGVGAGGVGIHVMNGGQVRVDGTEENEVFGGFGGIAGQPGPAVLIDAGGAFRASFRVEIAGGTNGSGGAAPAFVGAWPPVITNPPDLAMVLTGGIPQVGVPQQIIVVGAPGDNVALLAGIATTITPIPAFQINPLLIVPLIAIPIGVAQPDGSIVLNLTVPAAPPGAVLHLQCAGIRGGNQLFLTNATATIFGL